MKTSHNSLYFDEIKGKYSVINNETGESKPTYFTSEPRKRYSNNVTGHSNFHERVDAAKSIPELMPSLEFRKKSRNYIPVLDKLEGYGQFPNGVCQPFFNKSKLKAKSVNSLFRDKIYDEKNLEVFSARITNMPSYFTATYADTSRAKKIGTLIMDHRKSPQKSNFDGKTVKVINSTLRNAPRSEISLYNPRSFSERKSHLSSNKQISHSSRMKIHEERFTEKIISRENWTHPLPSSPELDSLQTLVEKEMTEKPIVTETLRLSKTFERNDIRPLSSKPQHQKIGEYLTRLKREKEELEGFHVFKEKLKERILTKGRFNVKIAPR